jgi:hypothetical protein
MIFRVQGHLCEQFIALKETELCGHRYCKSVTVCVLIVNFMCMNVTLQHCLSSKVFNVEYFCTSHVSDFLSVFSPFDHSIAIGST